MLARLLKFFGSLKLAVVLLVAIAAVLTVATFYESAENSRAAALNFYKTWWFNYGLLGLLAVNLAAAALTRWPWKRKHVGFVVTHAGIIVILGGCGAAFHYGTEGMMELRVGHPPSGLVRVEDEALSVVVPESGLRTKTVLRVRNDASVRPRVIPVTKNLRLTLDEYIPNTRIEQVVAEGGEEPNPAIKFRLQSELTGQNVSDWLIAASPEQSRASLGPARVEFVVARDEAELKSLLAEPGRPDSGVGAPTISIQVGPKNFKFAAAENVDKHLALGDTGIGMHIVGYWPDFRMDENHKPVSASEDPNNPAALVILTRGEDELRCFVFADPRMEPIVRTTRGQPIDAEVQLLVGGARQSSGGLTVALAPDGKTLHYAATSKQGFKSGTLTVGEAISPGWMDFKFTAESYVPNARITRRVERAPLDPEAGFPAIAVTAHLDGEQRSEWVRFGEHTAIEMDGHTVHMMFSWDSMPLPFTVELEDFVVERDEGTENVAGWTSKVVFHDQERGVTQRASISMNHPAWFSGYKFSQASWNPNDLKYTALQVKKDPKFVTWLTWTGAILITGGIALMFYFRRWFGGGDAAGEVQNEARKVEEMVTA